MRTLWNRMPFLGQLLVTATTALLVAGAAMLFVAADQEAAEIRTNLQGELARELGLLPATLAETVVVGDYATLHQMLDSYTGRALIASVSFQEKEGVKVSSTKVPRSPDCPAWFISMFDFADVQGRAPVVVGGRNYGELEVRLSAAHPAALAWSHLKSHMAILLLAIFVDFLGIWFVLRNGLRPLRRLEEGASDLAGGRLDVHIATEGGPEFRRVIDAFNRMVDAVRGSQGALRESEQRLENIIEGTHIGTWEWNVQTGEVVFSERWAEIVGYTLEELEPVSIDTWVRLVHPDDLKRSGELLERHFRGELPYYDCEARMRHKAGRWVWVLDRGKVFSWTADGKPSQMAGTHQDITSRKESEQALLEAKIAAESANVAKGQFLATMSHEIRTPLNVVLGMAQMLRRQGLAERDRVAYAQTILASGNTLLRLLTDLLDLAKVEAGKLSLDAEIASPAAIAGEVVEQYAAEAARKGVHLRLGRTIPVDRLCRFDAIRARQMLSNLIGNAVKFTESGTIEVTVDETGGDAVEAELEFSIADTGIGITDRDMARLFQPFSQVDASSTRRYGGSGLGLSIVRRLAELMHGTAGGTSVPGKGSRFWFRIRVERAGVDETYPAGDSATATDRGLTWQGNVLVVDDNKAPEAPQRKVDEARVRELVAELQPLLDANLFDAVATFYRLADELRGSRHEHDLVEVNKAIERLDLQGAAEALRKFDERRAESTNGVSANAAPGAR